jgi:SNF2 family DNA or RNA helicase
LKLLHIKPFDDLQNFEDKFLTKENKKHLSTKAQLELARQMLSPLILRRRKVDVFSLQELPPKTIHMVNHDLDEEELMVLQNTITNTQAEKRSQRNWSLLNMARMFVCHRALLAIHESGTKSEFCDYIQTESEWKSNLEQLKSDWKTSSRLECILAVYHDRMEKRKGDTKVMIFSEWYRFTLLIQHRFQRDPQFKGDIVVYNGHLSESDRRKCLRQFEEESPPGSILLITTGVGAEGITILSAAEVIFATLTWTPATELQASDRVWRLGQKKDVTVTFITSKSTIDHYVLQRRQQKYRTMGAILDHDLNVYKSEGQGTIHQPVIIKDIRTDPNYSSPEISAGIEVDASKVWPLFDRTKPTYAGDDGKLFLDEDEQDGSVSEDEVEHA